MSTFWDFIASIETKVKWASVTVLVVTGIVTWLAPKVGIDGAVLRPVVQALVTAAGAAIAGYIAKHTHRPDLLPPVDDTLHP